MLPWQLPEDLKHFRRLTEGGVIVMGRKTYDSIAVHTGGKPLPKRENWVISRQSPAELKLPPEVHVAPSLEAALAAITSEEVFVIGGAQIYAAALPLAQRLYLTLIDHPVEGDAFFPEWREQGFRLVDEQKRTEPFAFRFTRWER